MGFKSTHNSTTKRNLKADNSFKHKNKSYSKSSSSDESNTRKPRSRTRNDKGLPIPKGDSPYALAKQAEYKERDLDKAEAYYKLAIKNGERVESAIKDLASLLHQRGKTEQACKLLKAYKHLFFYDMEKFENLYNTLQRQLVSNGNSLNKSLKISGLSSSDDEDSLRSLFANPVRIITVTFDYEICEDKENFFAILGFNSHSSARKTLEGFHHWDKYKVEWVNQHGEVVGDAHYARQKMEEYRKHHPTFDYVMFERDPKGYVLSLPVDGTGLRIRDEIRDECVAVTLLGASLFKDIF
eukprot:CAMPEP_0202440206 /NCGR_PEP_ID=MMETSP1345-20130828/36570_1 /ASSEMBLY_ACC=CAM_ASM_000843 /TAXON_ID=342563 /ORGANISM="Fabrea Fabrea salina" /LENGTH=296 /DNA_ID=CAMNT_0049054787 /DNA_START=767 /DNA_END=1657 /DNA_ORIENTATION=+